MDATTATGPTRAADVDSTCATAVGSTRAAAVDSTRATDAE